MIKQKMSSTSIHEAIDTDGKFFVKNDVGDYENVSLYKLMISKKNSHADVTLDTGEIRQVNIDDLYV